MCCDKYFTCCCLSAELYFVCCDSCGGYCVYFVILFNTDIYASKHCAYSIKSIHKANREIVSIIDAVVIDINDETNCIIVISHQN